MKAHYWRLAILMMVCAAVPAHAEQMPYVPGSLTDIERAHGDEPFLLVLWEMSCPPCHGEMAMLGKLRQQHPEINLVFVGTDHIDTRDEVAALLEKHGLAGVESWLFAEDNKERLRHSIDPEWYGELPRNYFYAAAGGRTGVSGRLDEQRVRDWLGISTPAETGTAPPGTSRVDE